MFEKVSGKCYGAIAIPCFQIRNERLDRTKYNQNERATATN